MSLKRYYTFMIDPELAEALKVLKERDELTEGQQIRMALRDWFKRKGVTVKKADRRRAQTRRRP